MGTAGIPQPLEQSVHGYHSAAQRTYSEAQGWRDIVLKHTLTGGFAFALLALLEFVDINFRVAYAFHSTAKRLQMASYFSLDVLTGLILGLLIAIAALVGGFFIDKASRLLSRGREPGRLIRIITWGAAVAISAVIALRQPAVHRYVLAMIREAEKIRVLNQPLLYHERATSYLAMASLVGACSLVWIITRALGRAGWILKTTWLIATGLAVFASYYLDTREQVQLYEYTFHRSLFIVDVVLGMSFVATLWHLVGGRVRSALESRTGAFRALTAAAAVVVFGCSVSTFIIFGSDQNLQHQIYYQTAVTKQSYNLIQWTLDFDRDGYSAVLDGGDQNDFRADINPSREEVVGDSIDNDCLGGDLTPAAIREWKQQSLALRPASLAPVSARPNVIYIFVDALRADHLGAYGYSRNTSPNIDKLAAKSTVFVNGFAPSPRTSESVPKFMQSTYWDARIDAWTKVLKENGYNLFLFPDVRSWVRYERFFPDVIETKRANLKANIDNAIENIGNAPADQPFCAFVYAPDPHRPYKKHPQFNFGESLADLYDGEIAYTDYHLGRLFDWLEQTGRIRNTMVILMADHGESLGERGVYFHATQLYNEQTHVPMIFYYPNQPGRRVQTYVSTIDLGTTILNAAGINAPPDYFGVSLLSFLQGGSMQHPPLYGEQSGEDPSPYVRYDQQLYPKTKKYMVITQDGYKLIYNRDYYNFEMFNLAADPQEFNNLYDEMPEKARQLKDKLSEFVDVVTALRPWNADEGRYSRSGLDEGDKIDK